LNRAVINDPTLQDIFSTNLYCNQELISLQFISVLSSVNISFKAIGRYESQQGIDYPRIQIANPLRIDVNYYYSYSSPNLHSYFRPRLVYCMYNEIKYEIQTNMWVSNVSPVVWSLVFLTLVLMAVIHGVRDFVAKNNLTCYFSLLVCFANYFLHTVGTVSRQSLSHKSMYLAALELLFAF